MARSRATPTPPSSALEPEGFAQVAERYAKDVIGGRIVACKWVKLACRRHLDDVTRWGRTPRAAVPFFFSDEEAHRVCAFAETLPHIEGKWETPTIKLEPWQIFCLAVIFGWRRSDDLGRRFSKVYFEVARKNAKSTLAAVVTLYCLCMEDEPAPYVFIGATTGAQAQKVFHPAQQMARRTTALREAFGLQVWSRSITEPGGGYVQTINSKGSTQDGHNPHLAVLDELHAHKDRALYDVIDSAFGARRNPLLWIITTAGFDTEGVCYEQRTFATKVLESVVEANHFFGIIYTLDAADEAAGTPADDPYDERVWIKSNPNYGVSVLPATMRSAATEAKEQPGKAGEFLTKRLNVWTTARQGHINLPAWRKCRGPVDLEMLARERVPCWGGYDLGSTSDLTSLRWIWWLDGKLLTWGLRFLPEAAVDSRSKKNGVPYARWQKMEFMGSPLLTVTPGDVTDYGFIEKAIRAGIRDFNVQAIGYDNWNSQDLNNRLTADGAPLVEVRQGFASLSGPMKELDRLYLSGNFAHGGDEVLTWCASNVVARRDPNDNLAPSKAKSSEKIDDYAALLNALAVGIASQMPARSKYETEGLVLV